MSVDTNDDFVKPKRHLGIIGCRGKHSSAEIYNNSLYIEQTFTEVLDMLNCTPENTDIVSGGSKGTETLVEKLAVELGYTVKVIAPKLKDREHRDTSMNDAFHERNNQIIGNADTMLFYWDGSVAIINKAIGTCATHKKLSITYPLV